LEQTITPSPAADRLGLAILGHLILDAPLQAFCVDPGGDIEGECVEGSTLPDELRAGYDVCKIGRTHSA
jgi:hypothetical protein